MGANSSRPPPPPPPPRRHRPGIASFLCGTAAAASASQENELSAVPMPTRVHDLELVDDLLSSTKYSPVRLSSEVSSSSSTEEHLRSSLSNNDEQKDGTSDLRSKETRDSRKCFSESRELVPCLVGASSIPETSLNTEAVSHLASTSRKTEDAVPTANVDRNSPPVAVTNAFTNQYGPLTSPLRFQNGLSQLEHIDLSASGVLLPENFRSDGFRVRSEATSPPDISTTSTSWLLLGEEPSLEASSLAPTFVTSSGSGERTDGTILHIDLVSISSNILARGTGGDIGNHEARRNTRTRMFWDSFSRRSSRRNSDYATILLTAEDADNLGSRDRSLLDLSDDLFGDDSIYLRRRRHGLNRGSWHSRSEIRDRFRSTFNGDSGQTSFCPSGLHPEGACSCDPLVSAEDSTRASISRIVMLAEALFEVLDEIHRQPALSFSMASLPAPEAVVDSLHLKHYTKNNSGGSADDAEQCYICLAEYEEGESIRVLPCRHEYHMSCVDKWLKEVHGVCPLCRRNVSQGEMEESVS